MFRSGESVVAERKEGLLIFLQDAVQHRRMREDPALHAFLDLHKAHEGGSHDRPSDWIASGQYAAAQEERLSEDIEAISKKAQP